MKRPADYEEPKHATFAITENETNHLRLGEYLNSNNFKSFSQHDAKSTKPPGLNMEYDVSTDCYLQENTEVLKSELENSIS